MPDLHEESSPRAERKPKPPEKKKRREVRLVGNGIDMFVADISLEERFDDVRFARKAFEHASASLRRLELTGYKLVVLGEHTRSEFSLEQFK